LREADPARVAETLLSGVRREGIAALPWTAGARHLQQRLVFLHHVDPRSWPDVSDEALAATIEKWLGPHLYGLRSWVEVERLDLARLLHVAIPPARRQALDELAPTLLEVPSGSRVAIDYAEPAAPAVAVRLQEVFGMLETPRIAGGRVPLTFRLLSPAQRTVQVTRDLASFWRSGYFEVRKELKGRYPKHYWPDDPLTATATRRTRPHR
jgi:ATP-dependent helicase HrpB